MRDTGRHIMPRKTRKKANPNTGAPRHDPQIPGVMGSQRGAQKWRELARDFEVADLQYRASNIYLVYYEPYEDDEGGLWLELQHPDPLEDHEDRKLFRDYNRVGESAFLNLIARGLSLAGERIPESPSRNREWQNAALSRWGQLIIDKSGTHPPAPSLPEECSPDFELRRVEYLRECRIKFVQDSVLCCHQMEIETTSGEPPRPAIRRMAIGLRALLERDSMTQDVLAGDLRVSLKTISLWVNCRRPIPEYKFLEIERKPHATSPHLTDYLPRPLCEWAARP